MNEVRIYYRHFTLLIIVLLSSMGFSQTQESRELLKSQRLEQARQWLLFAGLEPPSRLDLANIGYLRKTLRVWVDATDNSSKTSDPPATTPRVEQSPNEQFAEVFYPSLGKRYLTFFQFKAEGQEQPHTVLINNKPTANPIHVLHKYSGTANLSQLVLSSLDVATVYSGFRNLSGTQPFKEDSSPDGLCNGLKNDKLLFQCLSRSRNPDLAPA